MKKYILIWLLIVVILLSGCNLSNEETPIEYEKINVKYGYTPDPLKSMTPEYNALSSDEKFYYSVIYSSTAAVVGEFISVDTEDDIDVFRFKKTENVYGKVEEDIIEYVQDADNYEDDKIGFSKKRFTVGEKYLLFLWKRDSVALPYSRYGICEHTYIPLNKLQNSRWGRGNITFEEGITAEEVVTYYKGLALERGYDKDDYQPTVFRDKDLEYVVKNSDVVIKVNVAFSMGEGKYIPVTTYSVVLSEALKGAEYLKETEENQYAVNTQKDALEKGKTYILTLSRITPDDKDSYFCLSAQNGIIPIEDEETVKKVYEWLNLK